MTTTLAHDDLGVALGQRVHAADLSALDLLAASGSKLVRWGPRWDSVEAVLGHGFDWTATDAFVKRIGELGMKLIFTVAGRDNNNNRYSKAYARFAAACVARYGDTGIVVAWELGNEANHFIWSGVPSPALYTILMKRAYIAIKAVDANAYVLTSGLGGAKNDKADGGAEEFLRGMYAAGAKDYFDGVAFHPYSPGAFADSARTGKGGWARMLRARQVMIDNGDAAKTITVTEWGYTTGGTTPNKVSVAQQAVLLGESVAVMRAEPWVQGMAWFDLSDDPNGQPANSGDYRGLLYADFKPKPAWSTFTDLCAA